LTANVLLKGGGTGAAPSSSSITDNGATVSTTELLRPGNPCRITSSVTLSPTTAVICSWTLPASALNWFWECSGTYSITGGTTPDLTLQMNASQAPTSENGQAQIGSTPAGTTVNVSQSGYNSSSSSGVQTIFAATTSISTVANAPWNTSGVIQASATAGTFAIQGLLSGITPAGSIAVGSWCSLQ
jgi:hypothetical protein